MVGGISGPELTYASGLEAVEYSVVGRGGSSFLWTVTGYGATITPVAGTFKANILFDQSNDDTVATITCIETTMGGISSEAVTLDVELKKFKPILFDDFLAQWTGTEEDGNGLDFTFTEGTETNTVVIPAGQLFNGTLVDSWGEHWVSGFGNEGSVNVELNLNNGYVTIPGQFWGRSDTDAGDGPWDYYIIGEGSWEGFNETMTITYHFNFDESQSDDYLVYTTVLTKQ